MTGVLCTVYGAQVYLLHIIIYETSCVFDIWETKNSFQILFIIGYLKHLRKFCAKIALKYHNAPYYAKSQKL